MGADIGWPEGLQAGLVLAGSGVDADGVALVHEEGHAHDEAGLGGRGLTGALGGIAGEAGLGRVHL